MKTKMGKGVRINNERFTCIKKPATHEQNLMSSDEILIDFGLFEGQNETE